MHKWNDLVCFCNSILPGGIIKRKDLLSYLNERGKTRTSTDTYRRILTRCGYLKTIKPGVYQLIKSIPTSLSYLSFRHRAYFKDKSNEYKIELFLYSLRIEVYEYLKKANYSEWRNDFNLIVDSSCSIPQFKKGTLTARALTYLNQLVKNLQACPDEMLDLGLEPPDHIDDLQSYLQLSKNQREFEKYARQLKKEVL